MNLRLSILPDRLAVCRLAASDAVPAWAASGSFSSVTRTPAELSIVTAEANVPADVRRESGFRAYVVAGPLDFGLTGVIASLTEPLARAGVPVFVVSTFDTDYLLLREERLEEASAVLTGAGHSIALAAG